MTVHQTSDEHSGDLSLARRSLTPESVIASIRFGIVNMLGFRRGRNDAYSPLEDRVIRAFERIVRKAHSPAILLQERELFEAFLCLKKYYSRISIRLDNQQGMEGHFPVFETLFQCVRGAAELERRIETLRPAANNPANPNRDHARAELEQARQKKSQLLRKFQRIFFADSDRCRGEANRRLLIVQGKPVRLEALLRYYKKGGQNDSLREARPVTASEHTAAAIDQSDSSLGDAIRQIQGVRGSGASPNQVEVIDWNPAKPPS